MTERALMVTKSEADNGDPAHDAGHPEMLLERILECASEGIYGLDRDGLVTFVNPAAARMTGRPRSEQLGRNQHELIHHTRTDGSAYPAEECPIHATLRDGRIRTIENDRFWRRDGTSFPVTYTSAPLTDATGAPDGVVVTFTDLTERPDERRYRSLVTATSAFVWLNSPNGHLTYISDDWLELVGLSLEEAMGWGWLAVVHPEDQNEYERRWRQVCREETVFDYEYRLCCRDGSIRWFVDHAVPIYDDAGRLVEWMGTGLDVTARRQAEEEVKRQREQYRTLVESTSAIFWAADPRDFRYTYVSPESEPLLGYSPDRWTEEPSFWVDHMHPDDRAWAPDYCARATEELRQHTFDYRMIAADGRTVWLRDVVSVLVEEDKPAELVGVMIDITATKENENALEYAWGLQSTLVEASQRFIASTPGRRDAVVTDVLREVGTYCAVDRSYLFRYTEDLLFADNTHEWCAPGIEPALDYLQGVPSDLFPNVTSAMKRHEVVQIPSVAALGTDWAAEKENLQQQNVQSLVLAPIFTGDSLYGFIGFDSVHHERPWAEEEIQLLRVLGDLIGTTIQREKAEEALHESEALRLHAESLAHLGSWEWDIAHDRFRPSAEWRRVTGVGQDSLSRDEVVALTHSEDLPAIRDNLERTLATGVPYDVEHRIIRRDNGETRWIKVHAELLSDNDTPRKLVGFVQDITERKLAEAAVAESEARYRSVVENISEVVYQTDKDGLYTFLNPAWEDITGFNIEETLGTHFLEYVHPEDAANKRTEYEKLVHGEQNESRFEVRYVTRRRGIRWIETRSRTVTDAKGRFIGCIGTKRDVTEQREAERQMLYLAEYDPLTDLPNRMLALDRLEQLINALPRSGGYVGVLYLDLDRFKKVNDTLGHEVGDRVLLETAKRLRRNVREQDTVARLGGDEFLILLGGLTSTAAIKPIVESLHRCFRDSFLAAGREITLSASIGVAIAPGDGRSSTELLRNADLAMYQSKTAGRDTHHYFTEEMNRDVARRMAIEGRLREALQRDEFRVVYQPVVDLVDNSVIGCEALLRWRNPELGDIAVGEFIPIAEQTGLIHDIGDYVLNQALHQAATWRGQYRPDFRVSVNVSPQQFRDSSLVGRIEDALHHENLPGEALEVEITEGVLLSGLDHSRETLHALRDLGVRIAMDDFGTGYASLSYLRDYSFDTLKIDRSFVSNVTSDSKDLELVVTSLRLASGLNLSAIAEGVENDAQLRVLRDSGCRLAQGYLFSRPVDPGTLSRQLSRWPVKRGDGAG